MRSSYQLLLLFAALLAVAALVGSFFAGLRAVARAPGAELDVGGTVAGRGASPSSGPGAARTRVEVLNGTDRAGLARSATGRLRDAGFDVVYFGNAPRTDSSVVLDRVGRLEAARAVAAALGIGRVRSRPDPDLYLDATVILGPDWPSQDEVREAAGWWARVVGWLSGE